MSNIIPLLDLYQNQVINEDELRRQIARDAKGGPPGRDGIPKAEMVLDFAHQYVNMDGEIRDHFEKLARNIRRQILFKYMLKTQTFVMDDRELFSNISKSNLKNLYTRMAVIANRITKSGKYPFTYRVNTKAHSVYIKFSQTKASKNRDRSSDVTTMIFNKNERYMIATSFRIYIDNPTMIDVFFGPFVYAEDPRFAKDVLRRIFMIQGKFPVGKPVPIISDMTSMFITYNAMEKIYRDVCKGDTEMPADVIYSDFEMTVFRNLAAEEFKDIPGLYGTNLIGVHNPKYDDLMQDSLYASEIPKFLNIPPVVNTIPKIAFSERELDRTMRYVEKIGMDVNGHNPINLTMILGHVKYGSWFRFSTPFVDSSDGELYLHWDIYPDYNWIRFYLIRYNNNGSSAYALVDFRDTDIFFGPDNLANINVDVIWGNISNMQPSFLDSIGKFVPQVMHDTKDLTFMLIELINIFIVMAERPSRTKVLRVLTPKAEVAEEQKVRQYRRTYEESDDPEEKDYVVTRILKSTTEANKMIEEARKSSGSRREARYVIESWERVGYWRRVAGTDRMVYIPATTCKRHLPLADDKEIHIKL